MRRGSQKRVHEFLGFAQRKTEGARVDFSYHQHYYPALSLTRLRRELPPGGSLCCNSPAPRQIPIYLSPLIVLSHPDKERFEGFAVERDQGIEIASLSVDRLVGKQQNRDYHRASDKAPNSKYRRQNQ